ncbi:small subunit rRNA processing factor, putative [Plasmodium chabaudi chabaudi]|uniref:Small subunit rRNA processing factor, putative n=1 Tax=Plasmodium chabaudi chabaudi TaxID=31271 RepID=A0A1D3S4B0_PLACU|nr:small subunit rRNA processing factor, putative [Plasmodium chabaudi chabaudi]
MGENMRKNFKEKGNSAKRHNNYMDKKNNQKWNNKFKNKNKKNIIKDRQNDFRKNNSNYIALGKKNIIPFNKNENWDHQNYSYNYDSDDMGIYKNNDESDIDINSTKTDNVTASNSKDNENCLNNQNSDTKNVNYVDYINSLKKNSEQDEEDEKNDESEQNGENEQNDENEQNRVYNFFLVFSPLAITSIKNKSSVINADEHMDFLEKKLESLDELIDITRNYRERQNLQQTRDNIKNKLDNIRLDILFFTLLSLRDSIINKKKQIQIYIHTINGLLIYVSPIFRVPRNFFIFKKVMLSLMKNNIVTDENKNTLLKILPNPVKYYVGSSTCVWISNDGFPTDAKKFADKLKVSNGKYSFFLSLSNSYNLTYFMEKTKNRNEENIHFNYHIKLSDFKLSPVTICSKLSHFLN